MSDLEMLKEIKSKFDYLIEISSYNKKVDERKKQEIQSLSENNKLDQIEKSVIKSAVFPSRVCSILTLLVLLIVPLFSYGEIYDHAIQVDPSLTFEETSSIVWDVILTAYSIYASLILPFSLFLILLPNSTHDNNYTVLGFILKTIAILSIVAYISFAIVMFTIGQNGTFWNVVLGILLPVIMILWFALQLLVILFGLELLRFPWIVIGLVLLLVVNTIICSFVSTLVEQMIRNKTESSLKDKRDNCLKEYNSHKAAIQQKYRNQYLYAEYSYDDVVARYKGFLHQDDINPDTINRLIWCIEHRYASDIISAKRWLAQQAHNKKIYESQQAHNQLMYEAIEHTRKIAEEAKRAAEAPVDVDVTVRIE